MAEATLFIETATYSTRRETAGIFICDGAYFKAGARRRHFPPFRTPGHTYRSVKLISFDATPAARRTSGDVCEMMRWRRGR